MLRFVLKEAFEGVIAALMKEGRSQTEIEDLEALNERFILCYECLDKYIGHLARKEYSVMVQKVVMASLEPGQANIIFDHKMKVLNNKVPMKFFSLLDRQKSDTSLA